MIRVHKYKLALVSLCGLLLLGALPLPVGATGGPTKTLPTEVAAPPPLQWQACPDAPTRDCATLTVPMDYAHPQNGQTLQLPVTRLKASNPEQRIGVLVINTGGPGNAAAQSVRYSNVASRLTPEIMERFDVVGLDPRGTTEGVTCLDRTQLTEYWNADHLPQNVAELRTVLGLEQQFNEACVTNNMPQARHLDTASSIRDIEQLRRAMLELPTGAVDEGKFSFIGFSYGTFMGQRYASLYPGKLRALVMDSVISHKANDVQTITESHIALDKSWGTFKQWCQANEACQLHGQDLDGVLHQAKARARSGAGIPAPHSPISTLPVDEWTLTLAIEATTAAGTSNFAWTDEMLTQATSGPTGDASLARYLYDALTGRGADGTYDPVGAGTHRSIACLDRAFSNILTSPLLVRAFVETTKHIAPYYGEVSAYQGAVQCYGYPVEPVEAPPLNSPVPASQSALIVSATDDATTPLIWAKRAQSEMPGSRLLLRDGDGHLNYRYSACVKQAFTQYLVHGVLPTNETHCATDPITVAPPPIFGPSTQSVPSDQLRTFLKEALPL